MQRAKLSQLLYYTRRISMLPKVWKFQSKTSLYNKRIKQGSHTKKIHQVPNWPASIWQSAQMKCTLARQQRVFKLMNDWWRKLMCRKLEDKLTIHLSMHIRRVSMVSLEMQQAEPCRWLKQLISTTNLLLLEKMSQKSNWQLVARNLCKKPFCQTSVKQNKTQLPVNQTAMH